MNNLDFGEAVKEITEAVKFLRAEGAPKANTFPFLKGIAMTAQAGLLSIDFHIAFKWLVFLHHCVVLFIILILVTSLFFFWGLTEHADIIFQFFSFVWFVFRNFLGLFRSRPLDFNVPHCACLSNE